MDKHEGRARQHARFRAIVEAYDTIVHDLDSEGPLPIAYIDQVGRKIYLATLEFEQNCRGSHPPVWWTTVWSIRKEMTELGYDVAYELPHG